MNTLNFAYIIKNHSFASLTPGSEHLLKAVLYVTWHKNKQGNCLDVRDDIAEKKVFPMFSYKVLASSALIQGIIVIADNKSIYFITYILMLIILKYIEIQIENNSFTFKRHNCSC